MTGMDTTSSAVVSSRDSVKTPLRRLSVPDDYLHSTHKFATDETDSNLAMDSRTIAYRVGHRGRTLSCCLQLFV